MDHRIWNQVKRGARFFGVLAACLLTVAAPATADTLPAATGTLVGATRTFDLWAKTGTLALPNSASVNVLGYADSAGGVAAVPGPMLIANQGETIVVNLNNTLAEPTALHFTGQALVPDLVGAAAGGAKTYTFTATSAGTYLYEAAPLPNALYQAAMGMVGALIVRPAAASQAYADAATTYDDEALLVLGEIDPALNANPTGFDLRDYAPKYFLINGKTFQGNDLAYAGTAAIPSIAGHKILLRYVNAGVKQHSMALLGMRQNFVAMDGSPLPQLTHNVVAESLAPGKTADAIATVPAATTDGTKYAVYDAGLTLYNSNLPGFGGMLTFVTVGSGTPTNTGPTTTGVVLTPNPTSGSADVSLTAQVKTSVSGVNVAAAEYFIDSTGAAGTGTPLSGSFNASSVAVSGALPAATVAALSTGNHSVYVHGRDDSGTTGVWGPFNIGVLKVDHDGPATTGLTLTPNPSSGSVSVALAATGTDVATGGSNVVAAEYFLGAVGAAGTGTPMTLNFQAPVAALTVTIPAPVTTGTVSVRSKDAAGNWGPVATIQLQVTAAPPSVTSVSAAPNPNNGTLSFNTTAAAVRVTASMTSGSSTIAGAEGFIDTVGAAGTGFNFIPSDGAFDAASETAYSDIPLTTVNMLAAGNHTIYVRARDAVGNWGTTVTTVLLIDKTAPTLSGITLNPTTMVLGTSSVTLTVNGAADPLVGGLASGLAGGEYWIDTTAPAPGAGTAFTGLTANIAAGALSIGTHTVGARVRDAAGNWSTTASATLYVVPDLIFANGFETGNRPWGWSSASTNTTGRLNVSTNAALVGSRGLQATGNNTNYVQYNFGTTANPAWPTYDARFYFQPNSNSSNGKDILASATSNTFGTTLFRVRYRLAGAQPQVQLQVGTTANANWVNINNTTPNYIEVVWQAVGSGGPNPGTLALYVNGTVAQTLTTTSTDSVGAVRLGSVTNTGNNTALYFDAFSSKRSVTPLIGP